MTQDVGTMRIKVIADTSDVEKSVKKTRSQMKEADKEAMKMRRSIARWETAQTGAKTGAKLAAGTLVAQRLTKSGGGVGKKAGIFAAKQILKRAIPLLSVAFAGLAAGKFLFGGGGKGGRRGGGVEETNDLLTKMLQQSIQSGDSLARISSAAAAARDPFGRGAGFHAQRMAQQGTAVTVSQAMSAGTLANSQNQLAEAQVAYARNQAIFTSSIRADINRLKAASARGKLAFQQAIIGGDPNAPFQEGGGRYNAMKSLLTSIGRIGTIPFRGPAGRAEAIGQEARTGFTAGASGDFDAQAYRKGFDAKRRGRFLQGLRHQGPGNILTPPPTVRAGSDEEYSFRAGRERIAQQRDLTKEWQDRVLQVLIAMERKGEGGVTSDSVFAQELAFGRVDGV